jgi:hypothetical protein
MVVPRAAALLGLACASFLACAGTRYAGVTEEEPLAKPSALLVYDFAVSADDLVGDALGPAFDPPQPGDRDHAIARELSEALVAKLREKGIAAERAETPTPLARGHLLLQGQFVTMNEGNRLTRMVIGFGAGRQEVRVQVQMYEWTGTEMRRLQLAEAGAHGDRMPGLAAGLGVGTAVTGAVMAPMMIGGTVQLAREGGTVLRPTLDRLAEEIAAQTAQFYRDRGWL